MITREDFFTQQHIDPQDYYGQLVNDTTKTAVLNSFKMDELLSTYKVDPYLNEGISYKRWENMCFMDRPTPGKDMLPFYVLLPFDQEKLDTVGIKQLTKPDLVGIAKSAARMIINDQLNHQAA